jgi:hypothetical protein
MKMRCYLNFWAAVVVFPASGKTLNWSLKVEAVATWGERKANAEWEHNVALFSKASKIQRRTEGGKLAA